MLHVIEIHIGYQITVFFRDKTGEGLWVHFLVCWGTMYSGYPKKKKLDQERSFLAAISSHTMNYRL